MWGTENGKGVAMESPTRLSSAPEHVPEFALICIMDLCANRKEG